MTEATSIRWLQEFAAKAEKTDKFAGKPDHAALLAAGLFGEAGSVIAELKKERREREAYPVYRNRMLEEVGDFLWYFVRLAALVTPGLIDELQGDDGGTNPPTGGPHLPPFLDFGAAVGDVLASINGSSAADLKSRLHRVWALLTNIGQDAGVSLRDAAERNTDKTRSCWPSEKRYRALFDDGFSEEEQLPRRLQVEFRERSRGTHKAVILRCNGINFGDRLTDNIEDPDGYRFHDIFHFAHAVHLGWSPVVRALMRSKRKSRPDIDEAQDGARAAILEEAVVAIVFSRAKHLKFFDGLDHVDFDLLKTVKEFVEGFEVAEIPLWQWDSAIIDGYRVFRALRQGGGGSVTLDLAERQLVYSPDAEQGEREKPGRRASSRGNT